MVAQKDANSHITTYAYDKVRRRTKRALPLGMHELTSYDAVGNIATRRDFNGRTTMYQYDKLNREVARIPDPTLGEASILTSYTLTGQRSAISDSSGLTSFHYDERDRLVTKFSPQGTLNYTYDTRGNVNSIRSDANSGGVDLTYSYNAAGRLASVVDAHGGTTSYTYAQGGALKSYTYPNGVTTTHELDARDRITRLEIKSSLSLLASFDNKYNLSGHRTSVIENTGRKSAYEYDSLYRLKKETITGDPIGKNGEIAYTLDPIGNRLSRTSTVPGISAQNLTYDANDRISSDTFDDNGNTLGSAGNTYAWSHDDRLTTFNATQATYLYNADYDRVEKATAGSTTLYLVDRLNPTGYAQVLEERTAAGAHTKTYSYGHDLLSQAVGTTRHFYGYDAHGSTKMLANASGARTDTYTYEAFGNELGRSGSTSNLYRYTGEQMDDTLGMQYLRGRYQATPAGRFFSRDPFEGMLTQPISMNSYAYATANPITFADPLGEAASTTEVAGSTALGSMFTNAILRISSSYTLKGGCVAIEIADKVSNVADVAEGVYFIVAEVNGIVSIYGGSSGNVKGRVTAAHHDLKWLSTLVEDPDNPGMKKPRGKILEQGAFDVKVDNMRPGDIKRNWFVKMFEQIGLDEVGGPNRENPDSSARNRIKALGTTKFDKVVKYLDGLCDKTGN